jgi:hypothetical protein
MLHYTIMNVALLGQDYSEVARILVTADPAAQNLPI